MAVSPVPEGFHTITPFVLAQDAGAFLEFCVAGFGAEVLEHVTLPDGTFLHGQVKIGDSPIMIGQGCDQFPAMPTFLHLYVPDMQALFDRAVAAGAEVLQPPRDEFYGDRSGGVRDAQGNVFWIATHMEDVSPEEIANRAAEARNRGDAAG